SIRRPSLALNRAFLHHLANDTITEYRASLRTRHGQKYKVHVVTRDDDLDLALLVLPDAQRWVPLDFIDKSSGVPKDARLYVLGFPLTADLSSAEGLLSSYFGDGGKWQTTLPLNFGNSGGPVFDIGGRVVGIAAGGFAQAHAMTLVIPADYALPMRIMLSALPMDSANLQYPSPQLASVSSETVQQVFPFSVTVDHQDRLNVKEEHCLSPGFKVVSVTPSISSQAGSGTHLISATPTQDRANCVSLNMFVAGNGVDRAAGIIINYRGRGWLSGHLTVVGEKM
ncbi:MAG TPA: trypsin-like peptidase domain-containing protein, partial [Promineifilum sp.]|nr:trypsin-like peptidase domain-containing protein [Promineifilum sp.]